MFALCVDDFGVKFFSKDDARHLIIALKEHYDVPIDWDGMNYCRVTFKWHYKEGYVDVFMPNHVKTALQNTNIPNQMNPSMRHIDETNPSIAIGCNTQWNLII